MARRRVPGRPTRTRAPRVTPADREADGLFQALTMLKLPTGKKPLAIPSGQNLALLLAGLVLGLTLAVRWQRTEAVAPPNAGARERAAEAIRQLEREQEQLKGEIAQLRAELTEAQRQAAKNTELLATLSAQLERERERAGLVPLSGPGVVVELDDSTMLAKVSGPEAELYIVHDYHLRDVVNLLWAAGAEAISVNSERLVNTTSIYCVGSTIMVNDTRLSPPYVIRAIGERQQIQPLLENPAFLGQLRDRVKTYGVQFRITWANQVDIPAYSGIFRIRYSHAGELTP